MCLLLFFFLLATNFPDQIELYRHVHRPESLASPTGGYFKYVYVTIVKYLQVQVKITRVLEALNTIQHN